MSFAYWTFSQSDLDVAVIETGLGGLHDGTNVLDRADKICGINNIGYDHTEILGETLEEIALHKAGIIKPGNLAFVLRQSESVLDVIRDYAASQSAEVRIVEVADARQRTSGPAFQALNFALAREISAEVCRRTGRSLATGVLTPPPGRFEVLNFAGRSVILDGAHNPQKLSFLIEALGSAPDFAVLFSLSQAPESKIRETLQMLRRRFKSAYYCDFFAGQDLKAKTSVDFATIQLLCHEIGFPVQHVGATASAMAAVLASTDGDILVTGSLYAVAEARQWLQANSPI